jgi:hypothetical protein
MGGACNVWGSQERYRFLWGCLKERVHSEDLGVDRILLKWIFKRFIYFTYTQWLTDENDSRQSIKVYNQQIQMCDELKSKLLKKSICEENNGPYDCWNY